MSHGVCHCGWEGVLSSIRFQSPDASAFAERETTPMCLTCRYDFRQELRRFGGIEIRVSEVTSTIES